MRANSGSPVPPDLTWLFGSSTRAATLSILASADRPLTGYRVAKLAGSQRIKVGAELRRLRTAGLAREVSRVTRGTGWELTDPNLRRFLRSKFAIVSSEDLVSDFEARLRETQALEKKLAKLPPVDLRGRQGWRPRYPEDFDRPPEKDRALARLGLRASFRRKRSK